MTHRFSRGFFGAAILAVSLTAAGCGGGGGGGSSPAYVPTGPGGPPPTSAPTPTPTPTPAPASVATSAPLAQGQTATVNTGPVTTNAGTVSALANLPAPTSGSGTASFTFAASNTSAIAPTGVLRSRAEIGAQNGQVNPLAFLSVVSSATITFPSFPAFTITVPASLAANAATTAPNGVWLAYLDESNHPTGWTVLEKGTLTGTTLSFAAYTQPWTLTAGVKVHFLIFAPGGTYPTPSPAPSVTPSAAPSTVPSAAPSTVPSASPSAAPSASPSAAPSAPPSAAPSVAPSAPPAAPTVGPLASIAAGVFAGTTSASSTGATVAVIGSALTAPSYTTVPQSYALSVNVTTPQSVHRSTRSVDANDAVFREPDMSALIPALAEARRGMQRTRSVASLAVRRPRSVATSFWIQSAAIGSTSAGTYTNVPATLLTSTPNWDIYVDSTVAPLVSDAATTSAIAADFDNGWTSDIAHYGSPDYSSIQNQYAAVSYCGSDGTKTGTTGSPLAAYQKPAVFLVSPNNLGTGVGGYFSRSDTFADAYLQCFSSFRSIGAHSNERPMVYVGFNTANPLNFELQEDLVRGAAHELQHMINWANKGLIQNGAGEDTYIDEGQAMLAQDFAANKLFGDAVDYNGLRLANVFLGSPDQYSLTTFRGIDPGKTSISRGCSGCYGGAYLLARYFYDRFGGDTYLHAQMATGNTGLSNAAALGKSNASTLLGDFATALASQASGTGQQYAFTFPYGSTQNYTRISRTVTAGLPAAIAGSAAIYEGGIGFITLNGRGAGITVADPSQRLGLSAGIAQRF